MCWLFFFFSSRRRHTRYWRDWSSDVCSSDLALLFFFHDSLIKWWESLILLTAYLVYVIFMKFNRQVETWVRGLLKPNRVTSMCLTVNNDSSNPPAANRLSDYQLEVRFCFLVVKIVTSFLGCKNVLKCLMFIKKPFQCCDMF